VRFRNWEVRGWPKKLRIELVLFLPAPCQSTHGILNVHLVILLLSTSGSSCCDHGSSLGIPAFDFRGYITGDSIRKLGPLMLQITEERPDLRRGLLRAGEELSEGFEGDDGGKGRRR
jgi:hypothetical protein